MNDVDGWIYLDGPEPEQIRPLLDAIRDLPPATPEDKERVALRFFEKLDAEIAQSRQASVAPFAPFAPSAPVSPAAPVALVVPAVPAEGESRAGGDGVTVRSPEIMEPAAAETPALPIAPPLPVAPPVPVEPVAVPGPRPPEGPLAITSVALEIPAELRERMGKLPFKPPAPGEALAWTMKVPVHNLLQGQTMPLGDDSMAKEVAALPFGKSPAGAALVLFPQLSLQAYASLRVELSAWPERRAEILLRYHVVNEAAFGALEEHWQVELAASPEARATFEEAVADYTAWLLSAR